MTSKHDDKTASAKVKINKIFKGGNPNEDTIPGRNPIEQDVSSN